MQQLTALRHRFDDPGVGIHPPNPITCVISDENSPQEFIRVAILRGSHDSVDYDEFEVGRGEPFGFQQEVSQVLVAATAVDV